METQVAVNILLERSELKINRAGLFSYRKPYVLNWRNVPDYDLLIFGKGEGYFEVEGFGKRKVSPGTAVLVSPRQAHGTVGDGITGACQLVSIHFDLFVGNKTEFFNYVPFLPIIKLKRWPGFYQTAKRITHEFNNPGKPGSSILSHNLTQSLLIELIRTYLARIKTPIACDERVIEVLRRLETDYAADLSASDIGSWVALSASHLRALFTDQLGITAMDALTSRRLRAAKILLAGSSEPVGIIARNIGYQDPMYFSRIFSQHVGISPRKYRESANSP